VANGKNGKNLIHKLDKETRNRHFPESNGGKGSHARKSTVESRTVYKSNYDAIDWSYSPSSSGKSYIKSGN
jgi:hypothetical protein